MGRINRQAFVAWMSSALSDYIVLFAVVTAVLVMGLAAGAVSGSSLGAQGDADLTGYVDELFSSLAQQGPAPGLGLDQVFANYMVKTALLLWVLGLSVIGAPAIAVVVFLRGFAIGFSAGFLTADLAWRGSILATISLAPHNLLIIPGLVWIAVGATAFSLAALQIMLGRPHTRSIFEHMQTEGALAVWGCVLLLGGGLIEAYITPPITAMASRFLM